MSEYAFKDIIIDPTSEKARNHIGKMVYFADNPTDCLTYANSGYDDMAMILESIQLDSNFPFRLGAHEEYYYSCIIPKKEEPESVPEPVPEPEYVPFDTIKEFVKASLIHNKGHYLEGNGIWIEESYDACREETYISMVSSFFTYGNTICVDGKWLKLEEVLDSYTFLDGTPCGKLQDGK